MSLPDAEREASEVLHSLLSIERIIKQEQSSNSVNYLNQMSLYI